MALKLVKKNKGQNNHPSAVRCPHCHRVFFLPTAETVTTASADFEPEEDQVDSGRAFREFREHILQRILMRDFDLPLLPHVAVKVIRLSGEAESSVQEIAKVVLTDQAIAARVLQVANSPVYSSGEPVRNMTQAIGRMGVNELKNVILAISLRSKVFRSGMFAERARTLWHGSLGSAFAGRIVAKMVEQDQETAFLCGLLHRIGDMVLLSLLEKTSKEYGTDFRPSEAFIEELLNQYGADVGDLASKAWELPESIRETIHAIRRRQLMNGAPPIAIVVALADRMCQSIGIGSDHMEVDWKVEPLAARLRLDEGRMADICKQFQLVLDKVLTELS